MITRAGKTFIVKLCPGANGEACAFGQGKRGAWLRNGGPVCSRCAERATVWDGMVSAAVARRHILALRRQGVGVRSICEAGDVSRTVMVGIVARKVRQIRKSTERKILAVDAGARPGGTIVDAKKGNAIIAKLRRRGLTLTKIGELLGYKSGAPVQLGKRPTMLLETLERLRRLVRQLERERPRRGRGGAPFDVEPPPPADFIPGDWLADDGSVLPQHHAAVAQLRRASKIAASR